ncbi:unnamed protein product [Phytomonas sp. EM1]|nr:unnamed protein product [Phytomonas sp. EM1]|eukprot:CCW63163.1 unnamed protein product [Phytomonas sp. isolate EM1]
MQRVKIYLSETHRLAILHQSSLQPDALVRELDAFGKISSHTSYILKDDNFMTLVLFSEPHSGERCYDVLKGNTKDGYRHHMMESILSVGWAHDGSEKDFLQKDYIREKFNGFKAENAQEEPESGYLVVFWERLAEHEREEVAQIVNQFALEQFSDSREGGRLFARLPDEHLTEDCRRAVLARYAKLGSAVSYADVVEFNLAKKFNGIV